VTEYAALPVVAAISLAAGIGCYFAAFTRFDNPVQHRNYHVFAGWGALFFLAGTFCFSQRAAQAVWLSLAAGLAVFAAIRLNRRTLGFHAVVYLGMAGYFSRLWEYEARALVGPWPHPPAWTAWFTALSTVLCCVMLWRPTRSDTASPTHSRQNLAVLRVIFSSLIAYVCAGFLVSGIVWLLPGASPPSAPILAMVRTFVICFIILAFDFAGIRWNYVELVRIAYGAIMLCALKLLFEDLRLGRPGSLAVSLLFYGSVFVLVSRLGHSRVREP
jgi:hypothetical protein